MPVCGVITASETGEWVSVWLPQPENKQGQQNVHHLSYPSLSCASHWIWGIGFLVAQMVKNPPAMQETPVQTLGWEDPLEKEMATHSSILTWRIP